MIALAIAAVAVNMARLRRNDLKANQLVIRGQINAARKAAPTSSGAKAKVMIQKATQSKVWGTQGDTESIGKDSNNEILFHPSA